MSNATLTTLRSSFQDRRVLILGLARQGWEAVRFFCDQGAVVTASDCTAVSVEPAASLPGRPRLRMHFGEQREVLLQDQDLICISAGVPRELPLVRAAIASGLPVVNDTALTIARASGWKTLITGSSGKTTTTALAAEMLRAASASTERVWVGGNIGNPLLTRADDMRPDDKLLWETSSFQLEIFDEIANPMLAESQVDCAALLNLTPNHLDRHPGMAAYVEAKLKCLHVLKPQGLLALNRDDPACQRLLGLPRPAPLNMPQAEACEELLQASRELLLERDTRLVPYSMGCELPEGACISAGNLLLRQRHIAPAAALRLRGRHNLANALAACVLASDAGAQTCQMASALESFQGLPHRLEDVAAVNGVAWINDSIATSPERAAAGLRSCFAPGRSLLLLAGGYDKGLPWGDFKCAVQSCARSVIAFGAAGPTIADLLSGDEYPKVCAVPDLESAVGKAAAQAASGDVVLLSPGAASFDQYADYEERGNHFRAIVQSLRGGRVA